MSPQSPEEIKAAVAKHYGARARQQTQMESAPACGCGGAPASRTIPLPTVQSQSSNCCGPGEVRLETSYAAALYGPEALTSLPESVTDIALGCGNPTAIAELNPGEVVLDLGSGGGLDCYLAAQRVGPEGRVIGVDMTPDMILVARQNAQKTGLSNVEFRLGEIEHLPVETSSVDVIISNCVINLSPDKDRVFREAFRVLKPGGRVSISDVVVTGELPQETRDSLEQWAGCVAGAVEREVYLRKLEEAGFAQMTIQSSTPVDWEPVDGAIESITVTARKLG